MSPFSASSRCAKAPCRVAAVLLTCLAVTGGLAACGTPNAGPPAALASTSTPTRTLDPATQAACDRARATIISRTETFTRLFQATVRAGESGATAERDRAFTGLRQDLSAWAADLDAQAPTAPVQVRAMLRQYAGAVRAALRRAPTVAQLDALYTFSETELDVAADQFGRTC
ncbi:MAG: hypothetical protein U0Q15_11490 [Kineosporiaceae bacterium]